MAGTFTQIYIQAVFVRHLEFFKKFQIFFPKCLFSVMFLLLENVIVNGIYLRVAIRKCAISFLP